MSSPAIYGGSRTKILTSKGLLLKDGTPIDYNGQKNYITKGTFATNATTGWNLKRTTLSNLIPNQVAASWTTPSVLSVTATSTGALTQAGFSLSLAASGVTTAGDMLVSDPYTIDIEDQAKTLAFKFSYKAYTNPSNLNFSGTSTNTFHVYIYDDANSAWIQPAGCYSTVQSSGVGIATGTFQTPANMTSFRIAIVSCNASLSTTGGGAFTMYFDNFSVGPQITNMGVPVTDLTAVSGYTLSSSTGSITNYTLTTREARRGDKLYLEFEIDFTGTSSAFSEIFLNLRPGLSIASSKIGTGGQIACEGVIRPLDAGVAGYGPGLFVVNSTTQLRMLQNSGGAFSNTSPFTFGNGDYLSGYFEIPIAGWSSNTVMSSDAAVNVVAASYTASSTAAVPNTSTVFVFGTKSIDTTGSYNASTGVFTVPVSGQYRVSASLSFTSAGAPSRYDTVILKNGSAYRTAFLTTPSTFVQTSQISEIIDVVAGDTISIAHFETVDGGTYTSTQSINIERISGPQSIAASETVAASLNWTTGTIGPNSNAVKVPLNSSVFDTHNGFVAASNRWIAPIAGIFDISATINFTSTNVISARYFAGIYKNGLEVLRLNEHTPYLAGVFFSLSGSGLLKLNAGDYIELWVYGAANNSVNQLSTDNDIIPTLSIKKIGN